MQKKIFAKKKKKDTLKQVQNSMRWKCSLPEVWRSWTRVCLALLAHSTPAGETSARSRPTSSAWTTQVKASSSPSDTGAKSFAFSQLESLIKFSLGALYALFYTTAQEPVSANQGLWPQSNLHSHLELGRLLLFSPKLLRLKGVPAAQSGNPESPGSVVKLEITFH